MLILLSHHIALKMQQPQLTYIFTILYKVKQPQMTYKYNSATHNNNNVLKRNANYRHTSDCASYAYNAQYKSLLAAM